MNNRKKLNLMLIIILIVLALGLGYAFLTTTLSINGTTDVDSNEWNVYWSNYTLIGNSEDFLEDEIEYSNNNTEISFHITLHSPGDCFQFTIRAINDGTIDAMVDLINKTASIPSFLEFTIKNYNGTEIVDKQYLEADESEKYIVTVKYKDDINPSDLPTTSQSLDLSVGIDYVQATPEAVTRPKYYRNQTEGSPKVTIGTDINETMGYIEYNNNYHHGHYLMLYTENNLITKPFLVLNNDGKKYQIEMNNPELYEYNKQLLETWFGSESCQIISDSFKCYIIDSESPSDRFHILITQDGSGYIEETRSYKCFVTSEGEFFCNSGVPE